MHHAHPRFRRLRQIRTFQTAALLLALGLTPALAGAQGSSPAISRDEIVEPQPCRGPLSQADRPSADLAGLTDLRPIAAPASTPDGRIHRQLYAARTLSGAPVVVPITCFANCNGLNWTGGCRAWTHNGQSGCTQIECSDLDGRVVKDAGTCTPGAVSPDLSTPAPPPSSGAGG